MWIEEVYHREFSGDIYLLLGLIEGFPSGVGSMLLAPGIVKDIIKGMHGARGYWDPREYKARNV